MYQGGMTGGGGGIYQGGNALESILSTTLKKNSENCNSIGILHLDQNE